jgi:hypothetical protein
MSLETIFVLIAAGVFAFGGYKRDALLVGVAGVILSLAVFFAWAVAG